MTKQIDCRGLACPAPVLETKNTIETEQLNDVIVVLDNDASKQNVCRFLESQHFTVTIRNQGSDWYVSGTRSTDAVPDVSLSAHRETETGRIMVMVTRATLGRGDDTLGAGLMISFLKTLEELGNDLWRLVFVNGGVKLTIDGSEVLTVLQQLENNGIHILVCGTCLDHFNLLEQKKVGETTNMLDIVTSMQLADKVVTL